MILRVAVPAGKNIEKLRLAASEKRLVVVFGTGASRGLTSNRLEIFSWRGLIEAGFAYALEKGCITVAQRDAWAVHLDSSDLDDLLGAAEFLTKKLQSPVGGLYGRWLQAMFSDVRADNQPLKQAIQALSAAGVPLVTLNYDSLLEEVTGQDGIIFPDTQKVAAWMRQESQAVLHLHGRWDYPASCVLGIRDYEKTLANDWRDLVQRSLSSFSSLVFVGCGDTFSDPNFSALIGWLRTEMGDAASLHYAFVHQSDFARRQADPAWHGFVEPIAYADHSDIPNLLKQLVPASTKTTRNIATTNNSHPTNNCLGDYTKFLLKDCGQMTIEGVRADLDTAQRKFDLERLFVPLMTTPVPPEIPANDPERQEKLQRWQEENASAVPFGETFKANKRLALLALPGGGKTLLLKRLAVAYGDPARRSASEDDLPDLNLYPVLVRCREWREYIDKPLPTIFENLAQITGQFDLSGFWTALRPKLRSGEVLLLVDGLDEIHNDAHRSMFVEHLERFLEDYPETRVIITSREAGFSLVAPTLARFCERWKLAPLSKQAIEALCGHWHKLMIGDTPEGQSEAADLSHKLLKTPALRRLAENPLLLTMLLVVKHGHGRLPPDRVSLYERAVEVLLDTWNIKGHDALNAKEAVPQLAYVAFELMRQGRQTATENELLGLLEEARENVPQIRRYAKDSTHDFLKRVELRSSLLIEAGYQPEGRTTVPFYQFRHLTFQEYLAAVASVEGHYRGYARDQSLLTPLGDFLTADEWKEVIPMAAVLAKKQAEPLIKGLFSESEKVSKLPRHDLDIEDKSFSDYTMPKPMQNLLQCLSEEAEVSSETLGPTLTLLSLYARGCRGNDNWEALLNGPYGIDFFNCAWEKYLKGDTPKVLWLRNTVAVSLAIQLEAREESPAIKECIISQLLSTDRQEVHKGLLTISGFQWGRSGARLERHLTKEFSFAEFLPHIEIHLSDSDDQIAEAAVWAWGLSRRDFESEPHKEVLDRLQELYFSRKGPTGPVAAFALSRAIGFPRKSWTPILTSQQKQQLKDDIVVRHHSENPFLRGATVLLYYAKSVLDDRKLVRLIESMPDSERVGVKAALKELPSIEDAGSDDSESIRSPKAPRKRRKTASV